MGKENQVRRPRICKAHWPLEGCVPQCSFPFPDPWSRPFSGLPLGGPRSSFQQHICQIYRRVKGRCRLAATSRPACQGEPVGLCSHCYRVAQGAVKAWQGCGRGSQRRRLNRGAGARPSFRVHLSAALPTPAPNHRRRPQHPQRLPVQGHLGAAEAPARHPATGCLGSLCVMDLPALA